MTVVICKPYMYLNRKIMRFKNLKGFKGTVEYSNLVGSMISTNIDGDTVSVFVPKDALKKVRE